MTTTPPTAEHAMPPDDVARIHARLDELVHETAEVRDTVTRIETRCGPCQADLATLKSTVYGNGKTGLTSRVAACETGRVDTLSVKSVCTLIAAVGTLAASIGAAIGGIVAALSH